VRGQQSRHYLCLGAQTGGQDHGLIHMEMDIVHAPEGKVPRAIAPQETAPALEAQGQEQREAGGGVMGPVELAHQRMAHVAPRHPQEDGDGRSLPQAYSSGASPRTCPAVRRA